MTDALVDFTNDEVLRNPYPGYQHLRETAPVLWDEVQQAWLVVGYPEARQLARESRLSAEADMSPFVEGLQDSRPDVAKTLEDHYESWMLFSDGPRHTRLRSLFAPALGADTVESYRQSLQDRARQILAAFDEGSSAELDVVDDYGTPLSRFNLAQVFGVAEDQVSAGQRWAAELVEFINIDLEEEQAVRTAQVIGEMADFVEVLSRSDPSPGSVGAALVHGLRTGELDRSDATGMVGQIVSGVMGAQPYLLGNAALAIWPSAATPADDRADGVTVADLVEEALRYDPPFLIVPRTATADIPVGEVTIRSGDRVGLLVGAANRDPRAYGCPHSFDATRERKAHVSFGTGAHYCLGSSLVRVFTEVALTELLASWPPASATVGARPHAPYFGLRAPQAVRLRRGKSTVDSIGAAVTS